MNQKPSLLIIGNSNVGKSSITRLLIPNPRKFKGKIGKTPGSTLLIRSINQENLPYNIVDLPGFGYVSQASRRRAEHIRKQIVIHIEKHYKDYFLALIIINILRIEDELEKYFIQNKKSIPLSFELINFLKEFQIPLLLVINKIDKVSDIDKKKKISFLINSAKAYGLNIIDWDNYNSDNKTYVPLLEFSALKMINVSKLKRQIQKSLNFAIK